uniref:Uncharacterized protein n=1 Tax=Knipowitschia caucasica TaxID=637954 RepID=A0AAV2JK64_KNICA
MRKGGPGFSPYPPATDRRREDAFLGCRNRLSAPVLDCDAVEYKKYHNKRDGKNMAGLVSQLLEAESVGLIMLPSTLVPTANTAVSPLPTNTFFLPGTRSFADAIFPPIYGLIFDSGSSRQQSTSCS